MIYHPLAVGELLENFGYDEEVISAGYLHDTVEDTNTTIDDITTLFGSRISKLVYNASEPDKSLPWEKRKMHTINIVANNSVDDIAVILADKIHNIEDLTQELKVQGLSVFDSFKRGIDKQLWYFEGIFNAVSVSNSEVPIVKRLERAIVKLKQEIQYQNELENIIFSSDKELLSKLREIHILKYQVKEAGYIKPFIIEVLGTPRTGKTTIINNILDFFKKGGFKVTYFKELVTSEFYNTINHLPLYDINRAIIDEIVEQIKSINNGETIKSKHNQEKDLNLRVFDDDGDIVIFDRGIYDRLIWFRRLLNKNEITQEQYDTIINQYNEYLKLVNCLLCFTASSDISLKRDYISSLALEKRGFLSVENIDAYNIALQGLIDDGIITNQYMIDTDDKTVIDTSIEVARHILREIEK